MKAQLNGIAIDYEVSGSGPVVLLSHGYGSTRHMWDEQHRALGDRWRVVSWDMRGHGQSDSPADPAQYSAAVTVADMAALLRHVGAERAIIGGLSLGGYVSLAFALAHPDLTQALVICDSGPGYRNAEARAGWNQRAQERAAALEAKGLEALGRRSRETQQAVHRSAQGLAHAARGMLAQEGSQVIDGLATIRVPTLIIVGDQDQPFVAPSEYMAKKIPGARLAVIPGAGHSSNLDQPEVFNRVLREFLAGL
ncbi:MAG TPA: alpha/beta fold hydrolase [Candidatus Binatia bacterium]|nr:alpha/beta fold hydrolase [Candidatus Binatia bacterium]